MTNLCIQIDRTACMGSGNCMYWASDVFALDDEGLAIVTGTPDGHVEAVRLAAENCPTRAITAFEENTGDA